MVDIKEGIKMLSEMHMKKILDHGSEESDEAWVLIDDEGNYWFEDVDQTWVGEEVDDEEDEELGRLLDCVYEPFTDEDVDEE